MRKRVAEGTQDGSARAVVVLGLVLTGLAGCGSSLYDVKDTDVRALSGESAERVGAAQQDVATADQAVKDARQEVEARQEAIAAADQSAEAADATVGAAKERLEAREVTLDAEIRAAERRRDQAIDEARRRFAQEVAQARGRHGELSATAQAGLRSAGKALAYEQARQRVASAGLARAEAERALRDAEAGAARIKLRLVTFVEVMRAGELNDEEVRQRQADLGSDLDDAEREVAELQRARDLARSEEQAANGALSAMERDAAPAADPDAPIESQTPLKIEAVDDAPEDSAESPADAD